MIVVAGSRILNVTTLEENGTLQVDLCPIPTGASNLEPETLHSFRTMLNEMAHACQSSMVRVVCPCIETANLVNQVLLFKDIRLGYRLCELPQIDATHSCIMVSVDMLSVEHFTRFFLSCFQPSDLGLSTSESVRRLAYQLRLHSPIEGVEDYAGYVAQVGSTNLGLFFLEQTKSRVCRLGPVSLAPCFRRTSTSLAFWSGAACLLRDMRINEIKFEIDVNNLRSNLISRSRSCDLVYCSLVHHKGSE